MSCTLFMGGPGSGKGTAINEIKKQANSQGRALVVIAPDDVIESLDGYKELRRQGESDTVARSAYHAEGTAKAITMFKERVAKCQGEEIIFDNTGGNLTRYQDLINTAATHGLAVKIVLVFCDLQTCIQRAQARAVTTGQSVPETMVRNLHQTSLENLKTLGKQCSWMILGKRNCDPMEGKVVAHSLIPGNTDLLQTALSQLIPVSV
ncbi:MAG TPA: zeta toxin family protein [Rhabdochlamydiaceae bacterium]